MKSVCYKKFIFHVYNTQYKGRFYYCDGMID